MLEEKARELAQQMRESETYTEVTRLKAIATEDPTNAALIQEYKRLQIRIQKAAVSGESLGEEMQRFQQLAALLMMNTDAQAYLMAEMRAQTQFASIVSIISEAAGFSMEDWMG